MSTTSKKRNTDTQINIDANEGNHRQNFTLVAEKM